MASTRLTNLMRDTFIEQVMNGIPVQHPFNIDDVKQKVRILIESKLPQDIKTFSKNYPNLVKREKSFYLSDKLRGRSVYVIDHDSCTLPDLKEFEKQKEMHDSEIGRRNEIRNQLYSVTYACTTVEKLKLALPELESYMPKANDRQLPIAVPTDVVVANLMQAGLKVPK